LNAYLLAKSGKDVVVLEKNHVGSGATEYTTAFITQAIDTDFSQLIKEFGNDGAKAIWQSGSDAIDLIEKIVNDEKIDCEFIRSSVYTYVNSEKDFESLKEEQKVESEYGFKAQKPQTDKDLGFVNFGYYELPDQAKFQPLKFLFSLSKIAEGMGVKIYEQSEVKEIEHKDEGTLVKTENNQIDAEQVVVATYQPFHNRIRMFLKRGMYRSYVLEARLPHGIIKEGMYWDTENPYHYFRIDVRDGFDRMILGGEDVKSIFKVDHEKSFTALKEYLDQIIPDTKYEITRKWIGPILEPSDGIALIGQTNENEYVATAFSEMG
jgi:glycine/D-amino acid oxidase-like deaminating enzyme